MDDLVIGMPHQGMVATTLQSSKQPLDLVWPVVVPISEYHPEGYFLDTLLYPKADPEIEIGSS